MLKIIRMKIIVLEMLVSPGLIIGAWNPIVSELRQGVPSRHSLANGVLVPGVIVQILRIFFNSR